MTPASRAILRCASSDFRLLIINKFVLSLRRPDDSVTWLANLSDDSEPLSLGLIVRRSGVFIACRYGPGTSPIEWKAIPDLASEGLALACACALFG